MDRVLTDAQVGVLSRLVEADRPLELEDLVAKTDAEATQLRLRRRPQDAKAALRALVKRRLARMVGAGATATAAGRKLIEAR